MGAEVSLPSVPSDLGIAEAIDLLTAAGYEYHGATTQEGSTVFSFRPPPNPNIHPEVGAILVEMMHLTVGAMLQEATIYLPQNPPAAAGNHPLARESGK